MKVGDLSPAITIDTNGDVTGASSLKLQLRRFHTTTVVEKTMTAVPPATDGVLTYQWIAGDTDTPGTYAVQAEVTISGKVQTFPQRSYLELVILP